MVFFQAVAQRVGFSSSYDRELREPLVLPQGIPVPIQIVGEAWDCSPVQAGEFQSRGIGPQFALKGESGGLSRVVAGNFGFPRVATVTSHGAYGKSGIFSSCEGPLRIPLRSV